MFLLLAGLLRYSSLGAGERFGAPILVPQIGHIGELQALAVSGDRNYVVTAGEDGTVKLWMGDGRLIRSFDTGAAPFVGAGFARNDREIYAITGDGKTFRWNLDGSPFPVSGGGEPILSVTTTSDGNLQTLVRSENRVELIDGEGVRLASRTFESGKVSRALYFPDRKRVLATGEDGRLFFYAPRPKTEEELQDEKTKDIPLYAEMILDGGSDPISSMACSPDGKNMATGSLDGNLRVWNSDRELLRTIEAHEGGVSAVRYSNDGKLLVTGGMGGKVKIWSPTGVLIREIPAGESRVTRIRFTADDRLFLVAHSTGEVGIWNAGGRQAAVLRSAELAFRDFRLADESGGFFSAGSDGKIRKHVGNGSVSSVFPVSESALTELDLSPDRSRLAAVDRAGNGVILDANTGVKIQEFPALESPGETEEEKGYTALAFLGNESILMGTRGGYLVRYGFAGGEDPIQILRPHEAPLVFLSVSPDAKKYFTVDLEGNYLLQKDDTTLLLSGKGESGDSVRGAFSVDNRSLLVSGIGGRAVLYSFLNEGVRAVRTFEGPSRRVAISADGKLVASGGDDERSRVWTTKGELVSSFEGHLGSVRFLQFSMDGRRLFAGDRGGMHIVFNGDRRQLSVVPTEFGSLVYDRDHHFDLTDQAAAGMVAFRLGWGVRLFELNQFFDRFLTPGLYRKVYENTIHTRGLAEVLEESPAPRVELTIEKDPHEKNRRYAKIRACDTGGGVKDPVILWNRSLYSLDLTNELVADRKMGCLLKRIPLVLKAGENIFQASASSDEGMKGFSEKLEILNGDETDDFETHLILISIGRYPMVDGKFQDFPADARAIAEYFDPGFERRRKGEKDAPPAPAGLHIHSLTGSRADRRGILAVFQKVAREASPDDQVIVYLGGAMLVLDGRFLFLQVDNRYDTVGALHNGINQEELIALMSSLRTPKKLLLLDGQIPLSPPARIAPADELRVARILARGMGIHIASSILPENVRRKVEKSAGENEEEDEDGKGKDGSSAKPENSILVTAFLEALEGKGAKDAVKQGATRNILPYLEKRILELRSERYELSRPLPADVSGQGMSFSFFPNRS